MTDYEKAEYEFHNNYSPRLELVMGPKWNEIKNHLKELGYFKAPASSRFHLSIPGGLLIHSVAVTALALRLKAMGGMDIPDWRTITAGLLHDVGKCGLFKQPKYTAKENGGYTANSLTPFFTVRDLSAIYASQWRSHLPDDVLQAILVHDGAYIPENRAYAHNLSPVALIITVADTLQAQGFETPTGLLAGPEWLPKGPEQATEGAVPGLQGGFGGDRPTQRPRRGRKRRGSQN